MGYFRKKIKSGSAFPRMLVMGLAVLFLYLLPVSRVFADNLDSAKQKKTDLEKQKKNTEAMLSNLNSMKSDVNKYVKQLDTDLAQLTDELDELNQEILHLEGDIAEAEADLAEAQAGIEVAQDTINRQYETMKLRIKYMYERSDTTLLDMLFSSKNVMQLLNRGEYVERISDYDRKQLDEYEHNCDAIKKQKAEIEEKKKKLEEQKSYQETLLASTQIKRDGVEALIDDKKTEIEAYEQQIGTEEEKLKKYEEEIKRQESTIKAIEAEIKRREEEARKAAEQAGKAYKTVDLGDISFLWPCPSSSRITSYFGDREAPVAGASTNHKGIDIGASSGSSIVAAASGEVIISTYSPSAGNYIMINHGGGVFTVYMHASELYVSEGETVNRGQKIAAVGSTGYSSGPHLHFGIRADGSYLNPLAYVSP